MRVFVALAVTLLASPAALASPPDRGQVSNEAGLLTTVTPGDSNDLHTFNDTLMAMINLTDAWTLNAGAMLTLEGASPPQSGTPFETSAEAIPWFTLGLDWDINDNWMVGFNVDASPKSTRHVPNTLTFTTTTPRGATSSTDVDALLEATNSSLSGGLTAAWDSGGDSAVEFGFTTNVAFTHLSSEQQMQKMQRKADGQVITRQQAIALCSAGAKVCSKGLKAVLQDQQYSLDSVKLNVAATATFLQDTDVTASVDGYVYAQDPTDIGFFRVATSGRTSASGGGGMPIAPLTVDGRVELLHRFGAFSARVYGTAGKYAADTAGNTYGLGLKAQYKFNDRFKLWLTVNGQWDTDVDNNTVTSRAAALGLALRF